MSVYLKDGTELYHYGIPGMKWGERRYQNPDGTLTEEGKRRYGINRNDVKRAKAAIRTAKRNVKTAKNDYLNSKKQYKDAIDKAIKDVRSNQTVAQKIIWNEGAVRTAAKKYVNSDEPISKIMKDTNKALYRNTAIALLGLYGAYKLNQINEKYGPYTLPDMNYYRSNNPNAPYKQLFGDLKNGYYVGRGYEDWTSDGIKRYK